MSWILLAALACSDYAFRGRDDAHQADTPSTEVDDGAGVDGGGDDGSDTVTPTNPDPNQTSDDTGGGRDRRRGRRRIRRHRTQGRRSRIGGAGRLRRIRGFGGLGGTDGSDGVDGGGGDDTGLGVGDDTGDGGLAGPGNPDFDEDVYCEAAAADPTILDELEVLGDDHVQYCHSSGCSNWVFVDSNVDSCLPHLDHRCDVFSRAYGCGT